MEAKNTAATPTNPNAAQRNATLRRVIDQEFIRQLTRMRRSQANGSAYVRELAMLNGGPRDELLDAELIELETAAPFTHDDLNH